jgi:hypothetical protein
MARKNTHPPANVIATLERLTRKGFGAYAFQGPILRSWIIRVVRHPSDTDREGQQDREQQPRSNYDR